MPVTNTTSNRGYQLPHASNYLDEDVARLIAALNAIDGDMATAFSNIAGKAATGHGHVINDVSGLQAALDGKMSTSATFTLDSLTDVDVPSPTGGMFLRYSGTAWVPVVLDGSMIASGTINAARLPTHTHAIGDVTGLSAALSGKSDNGHAHAIADVTGLTAALAAKADLTAIIGQQAIFVPALAMYARTTNGPGSGSVELSTNKVMLKTLDFDTTTQEFAQFAVQMPKSWDRGTLICQFIWSHPATTTNFGVAWQIQAVALADDDAGDTAFGTAVTVTDTGGTTNDIYITAETSALTVGNSPGSEEWVVFQVARAPANGSDTMAVDARLHGVKIHYTTSAAKDD